MDNVKDRQPLIIDYAVENHGSLFLVRPQNDAARQNLLDSVQADAQWLGRALAVEHRYIQPLVAQLREEGWVVA